MTSVRNIFVLILLAMFIIGSDSLFKPNHRGFLDFLFNNAPYRCNCKCGQPNRESRILGGEYLKGHEFPWIVTIPIQGTDTLINGVLINDQYVLTAANQVTGLTAYNIKVTLGQYDSCLPDVSSTNVSVESIKLHPDFNPATRAHDLALIKLSNVLSLERRIKPICLPTPGTNYRGQVATVVGWTAGQTLAGQTEATCRPRKLGLPVLGAAECHKSTPAPEYLSPDKGCIGIVGANSYVCQADAGGPVTFRTFRGVYELIGILTDKNDCGPAAGTALYTKINENIKWILQQTNDACYCTKF